MNGGGSSQATAGASQDQPPKKKKKKYKSYADDVPSVPDRGFLKASDVVSAPEAAPPVASKDANREKSPKLPTGACDHVKAPTITENSTHQHAKEFAPQDGRGQRDSLLNDMERARRKREKKSREKERRREKARIAAAAAGAANGVGDNCE